MRLLVTCLILLSTVPSHGAVFKATSPQAESAAQATRTLVGRWRVKFMLSGGSEKNLILDSQTNGVGAFRLLDTGPDDKPVATAQPAVWSLLTNDRVSFSGDVELPIGTCCREIGTLMFKGKFVSGDSISGKLVFVTSVDEQESPYQFRSVIGTFSATRLPNKS